MVRPLPLSVVVPILGRGARGQPCNAWLIDGLLVDPTEDPTTGRDSAWWRRFAMQHAIDAIAITHWHADHTTGVKQFAKDMRVALLAPPHRGDRMAFGIGEGDHLLGRWLVIATPGHAEEHVSFWDERERILIAGDALDPPVGGIATEASRSTAQRIAGLGAKQILLGHGHTSPSCGA